MNMTVTKTNVTNLKMGKKAVSYLLVFAIWILALPVLPLQAQDPSKDENLIVSPQFRKQIERTFGKNEKPATYEESNIISSNGTTYDFAVVEFRTTEARNAVFASNKSSTISGVTVLTVFDRFADVFISSKSGFDRLIRTPGILWLDRVSGIQAPPPPPFNKVAAPSKAVPDRIVRRWLSGP